MKKMNFFQFVLGVIWYQEYTYLYSDRKITTHIRITIWVMQYSKRKLGNIFNL